MPIDPERLKRILASAGAPDKQEEASILPKPISTFLKPATTSLGIAFDWLNRPQQAVAGAALAGVKGEPILPAVGSALAGRSKPSFSDVLGEMGVENPWIRYGGGLVLDIATDPLNLIPAGWTRAASKAAKLPRILEKIPVARDVGRLTNKYYGLPEDYAKTRWLLDVRQESELPAAWQKSKKMFKGLSDDEARQLTIALEKGPLTDPRLEAMRKAQQARFVDQYAREVAAGVQTRPAVPDYVTYLRGERVPTNPFEFIFGGSVGQEAGQAMQPHRLLSAKNPFSQAREIKTIEEALAAGSEPNIKVISAIREATGNRAINTSNFLQDAIKQWGTAHKAGQKIPEGYRAITIAGERPIKDLVKGTYFPERIAADIEKMVELHASPGETEKLFRVATQVWKGYATAANPGFHVRNTMSNVINMWLGGVKPHNMPTRFAQSEAWALGKRFDIGGYRAKDIEEALQHLGIESVGHGAFSEIAQLTELPRSKTARTLATINPLSRFNPAVTMGRKIGMAAENLARRAMFIDKLHVGSKAGKSFKEASEDAAMAVRDFLFDYNELTDAEKKVRDFFIPFYTWTRKNLPLQLRMVLDQPQKFAHMGKWAEAAEDAAERQGLLVPPAARPEYMQRESMVNLPWPTTEGDPMFWNPDLPPQDLNRIPMEGGMTELGRQVGMMLNPFWKSAAEYPLNRVFFTGGQIWDPNKGDASQLRPAIPTIRLLERLGIELPKVPTREGPKPAAPAWLNYGVQQIPFVTKLGKMLVDPEAAESGHIVGRLSPQTTSFAGVSLTPFSKEDQANQIVKAVKRQIKLRRAAMRQKALNQ